MKGAVSPTPKIDDELMEKCDYDYHRYLAAKEAIAKGETPAEFNDTNTNQTIEGGELAEPDAVQSKSDPNQKEEAAAEEMPVDTDTDEWGRARKNIFGQIWRDTVEPPLPVKIAFADVARKLQKGETISGEDVTISTEHSMDRVAGTSLVIAVALQLAYFRYERRGKTLDAGHL
jgi:hypothetical protein